MKEETPNEAEQIKAEISEVVRFMLSTYESIWEARTTGRPSPDFALSDFRESVEIADRDYWPLFASPRDANEFDDVYAGRLITDIVYLRTFGIGTRVRYSRGMDWTNFTNETDRMFKELGVPGETPLDDIFKGISHNDILRSILLNQLSLKKN